jgi:hypothetical protein
MKSRKGIQPKKRANCHPYEQQKRDLAKKRANHHYDHHKIIRRAPFNPGPSPCPLSSVKTFQM